MHDILNAAARPAEQFPQAGLAFDQWLASPVLAIEHEQIEGAGDGSVIIAAAVQSIEIGKSIGTQADHLGVNDGCPLDAGGLSGDQRIAFGPVCGVHCVEPHSTVAGMDLQPISVVLELMYPARAGRRLVSKSWSTRPDKTEAGLGRYATTWPYIGAPIS